MIYSSNISKSGYDGFIKIKRKGGLLMEGFAIGQKDRMLMC